MTLWSCRRITNSLEMMKTFLNVFTQLAHFPCHSIQIQGGLMGNRFKKSPQTQWGSSLIVPSLYCLQKWATHLVPFNVLLFEGVLFFQNATQKANLIICKKNIFSALPCEPLRQILHSSGWKPWKILFVNSQNWQERGYSCTAYV